MPATSIRDLVIKDDDVVVGTHGRGFWILDDITPLRQLTPAVLDSAAHLFRPGLATRVRFSMYTDTPMPRGRAAVRESAGRRGDLVSPRRRQPKTCRSRSSTPPALSSGATRRASTPNPDPRADGHWPDLVDCPVARTQGDGPGLHRFAWDLRYARPNVTNFSFPISAIPGPDRAGAARPVRVARNVYGATHGRWSHPTRSRSACAWTRA